MRKNIFLILSLFSSSAFCNIFQENCFSCHGEKQLMMFMSKYTLAYSGPKEIKQKIIGYLKYPDIEKSLMPRGFLNRFGLKETTTLTDKELQEAINYYYNTYNLGKKFSN